MMATTRTMAAAHHPAELERPRSRTTGSVSTGRRVSGSRLVMDRASKAPPDLGRNARPPVMVPLDRAGGNQPGEAVLVHQHAETLGKEGLLQGHVDPPAFGQGVEGAPSLAFGFVAEGDPEP